LEYRFAQLTLGATLFLLFVGATVHPTGSSLACPEWLFVPTCNYELTPTMKGGVLYEHGHRLAAFLVGVLTVALAFFVWRRRREDRVTRVLALFAVGMVVLQGALGGLTVLLGLSAAVSVAHLGTAMAFFLLILLIAHRLRPPRVAEPLEGVLPTAAAISRARVWAGVAASVVFVQILLGAVVRHSGAALACVDLPLCGGLAWPEGALRQLHMIHRYGAVVALVAVGVALVFAWQLRGSARRWALSSMLLLLAQGTLGVLSVTTFIQVHVVVAHLLVGALLLATTFKLYLILRGRSASVGRAVTVPPRFSEPSVVVRG
jgi:cytochrome c oxidase assembly protein subunit 15